MSDYTQAPATEILATQCAACARPLLDATSVELGIGPECRKKYAYSAGPFVMPRWERVEKLGGGPAPQGLDVAGEREAARVLANKAVNLIARLQTGPEAAKACSLLFALGYTKLAARIADRLGAVSVEAEGSTLLVRAPYSEHFNALVRRVPGARWDAAREVRIVLASGRKELWAALRRAFAPGTLVVGPLGVVSL